MARLKRTTIDVLHGDAGVRVELAPGKHGRVMLTLENDAMGRMLTPLLREDAAKMRKWLNVFFAKGCEKHGTERCIECEKRCQWCGDDGEMKRRDGDRVCESCAYSHDQGDFD